MISIERLQVTYGSHKVLQDLNLSLSAGIHGIVGLNGAGKTTLLNTLAGMIKPSGGSATLDGKPLFHQDISFLETKHFFYSRITGREYLELFRLARREFDISGWNALFELPLDNLIENYSTGMQKKLAFMGVICLDRPVLILDEPYNGVDLESYRKMKQVVQTMNSNGRIIIITSHILESLTSLCDHIHYLKEGRISLSAGKEAFAGLEDRLCEADDQKADRPLRQLLDK
jgi:ABC-2 type transport system ATP-binding protein